MRRIGALTSLAVIALAIGYRIASSSGPEPSVGLYWTSSTDPTLSPGVCGAPLWQLLIRTDTQQLYYKSSSACTGWTALSPSGSSGITGTLTSGILPVATGPHSIADSSESDNGVTFGAGGKFSVTLGTGATTADNGLRVIDTVGTGLSQTANSASLITTCAIDEPLQWNGSAWVCGHVATLNYSLTCEEWQNDFLSTTGGAYFTNFNTGTGSGPQMTNAFGGGRIGVVEQTTGSTNTGKVGRDQGAGASSLAYNFANNGLSVFYEIIWDPEALSTVSQEYSAINGCVSPPVTSTPTDGCFWLYDRANATGRSGGGNTWNACCCNNNSCTCVLLDGGTHGGIATVNTPVNVAVPSTGAGFDLQEITITKTSAIFAAQQSGASTVTTRATITTNIPDGSTTARGCGLEQGAFGTVGGGGNILAYDWELEKICMTAARNPTP